MSTNTDADVAFIRALAELLRETELTEIEVVRTYSEDDEVQVRLSRASAVAPVVQYSAPPAQVHATAAGALAPSAAQAAAVTGPDLSNALTSPMVGTAYLSSEPGSEPFIKVGDTVSEGQTVLIIEAMKTMNQIPSPRAGTIKSILVANAEPVEFGHPLMIIE
jgi:acetyl-CoA carboxylase biotin carboxyl carrier protein